MFSAFCQKKNNVNYGVHKTPPLIPTLTRTNPHTFLSCLLQIKFNIVAYLLKAGTVEAEKQPLLGNDPYKHSRGTRHVGCDVMQQKKMCCKRRSLWIRAALVATQVCGKHISAAVNQHATIEKVVFSVGPSRGYITRISRS
jgi:hypothetical protein